MELANLIIKIDELKEQLNGFRPLRADHLNRLNQKLNLDWNYHSNSIEGNSLTRSETKAFILDGITAKGKPFRDYLEMKGHNEALKKLYQIVGEKLKITENLIKEFHQLILVEPYADKDAEINPGQWKTLPNYIETSTGERVDFEPPEEVAVLMNELINWLNNHISPPKRKKKEYDLHPLLIAAGFHIRFLKIHPFGDGNGRMARILTNLILMMSGYVPAIVKLEDRQAYYSAILASSSEDYEAFAVFLGKATIASLELAIKAAKGEKIEEDTDLDKELSLINKRLEARKNNLLLRSDKHIAAVFKESGFLFFNKMLDGLSKFDDLFEKTIRNLYIDNRRNGMSVSQRMFGLNHRSKISADNIYLSYTFSDLKNTEKSVRFDIILRLDFDRTSYTISDNITNKKLVYPYDMVISSEEQAVWIKAIQKELLTRIKAL